MVFVILNHFLAHGSVNICVVSSTLSRPLPPIVPFRENTLAVPLGQLTATSSAQSVPLNPLAMNSTSRFLSISIAFLPVQVSPFFLRSISILLRLSSTLVADSDFTVPTNSKFCIRHSSFLSLIQEYGKRDLT